jgi:hypothetical protein
MSIREVKREIKIYAFSSLVSPRGQQMTFAPKFLGELYDRAVKTGTILDKLIDPFPFSTFLYTLKPRSEIMLAIRAYVPDNKSQVRIEKATDWLLKNLPHKFEGEKYQRQVGRDLSQDVVNNDVIRVLLPRLKNKASY